ncbi:MAG: F0F1 ATP synthase subunit gamma [Algoriphagus sp.]|uniref:F0F1 ATP synthase subunit gamma n=1 Tax=Algoriphagus sp. TaxID=1872435 RepID=UPI002624E665|nr:F0F1 ATP synthase subunit gamma [Algoriphagus sp.]MDG1278553.1 F0F1 ATP synthase subunit gamma [Algoriphagus sp.]
METLAQIRRKLEGAEDLKTVVRTMKAMAASNIGQYEQAGRALSDYYRTVALGIVAYFHEREELKRVNKKKHKVTCAIVFGSDQGLVGQFNNTLTDFVKLTLNKLEGEKIIWAIGDRIKTVLLDRGFTLRNLFHVPNSVDGITPLVSQILLRSEESIKINEVDQIYIFHNQPNNSGIGYTPVKQKLLPLDEDWKLNLSELKWPTKIPPQVAGGEKATLLALIHEFLFVSLYRASAESLASENASRLLAMQRAEKNIEELLENLNRKYHSIRQTMIDEELFDVISGFEALKKK